MKLLLITSTYPTPWVPTQGVFNGQLVAALNRSHSVRVIAPVPWTSSKGASKSTANALSERGSSERSIQSDGIVTHPTFYYPPMVFRWTYGFWYWKSIERTFLNLTKTFQPDVVLGYWAHPDSEAAIRAAASVKVPCVVMVGGSDIRILAKTGKRRVAIQSVLRQANRVVAFSEDLARHVSQLGVPTERIEVVYRGVDRSLFAPRNRDEARVELSLNSSDIVLTWVGRLVDVKNPAMAIHAAVAWTKRYGKRFRLVLIGDGPLKAGLQRLAEQLGIQHHCSFLGALPHASIANWFQAANLTILTSHSEGVPNVLLESNACGTPFVATDVGGVREIADLNADTLIPPGDVGALQHAVIAKLEETVHYQRPQSQYDVDGLAHRIVSIIERL